MNPSDFCIRCMGTFLVIILGLYGVYKLFDVDTIQAIIVFGVLAGIALLLSIIFKIWE
jgi:hypothetical protein